MNQKAIRAVSLAVALVVAIAFGIHHHTVTVHASAAVTPDPGPNPFDDNNGNLTHSAGACAAASSHGRNQPSWVTVACNTLPANCKPTSSGAANVPYDVDKMVSNNDDPNICLRRDHGDTVTWSSASNSTIRIEHLNAAGTNNAAHPFSQDPPFGNGSTSSVTSPAVASVGGSQVCYKFNSFIEVQPQGGAKQCWDPHIYTSCDTSCGAVPGKPKKPAPKKQ